MSDDLKINLSGKHVEDRATQRSGGLPGASRLDRNPASDTNTSRPVEQTQGRSADLPAQNNLPVPVLAERSGTTDGATAATSGKYEREAREEPHERQARGGQNLQQERTGDVLCRGHQTWFIPTSSAASNVQPADAAGPQDVTSPTLTTQEQRQPSLRPSPISGVTPPIETRWKKGCPSPNPGGRPKITREETAKWLEEKGEDGKTNARKAIESVGKVAQSSGRHSASALKTLHDILPDDKKDESKGGFNIGSLNVAILTQIQRAATGKDV